LYRKEKENVVANALFWRNNYGIDQPKYNDREVGNFSAEIKVMLAWYEEIYDLYIDDTTLRKIVTSMMVDASKYPYYTYVEGIMRYKWRIEDKGTMREQLVKVTHDFYIDSHTRIQNSYKRLKILFYWLTIKKMVQQCDIYQ